MDISFVVIGYNESATLGACFRSIREADLAGLDHEILYVDGGSQDNSLAIARAAGVDACLGGEQRRRAAQNRNLGLARARGRYVQFLDGDMTLDPGWIRAGLEVLEARADTAVAWGYIREANQSVIYRMLQLDWEFPEGDSLYCGGAALYRRDPLQAAGGFPEDVAYGEEPYLCWRIRNEQHLRIHHVHHPMVNHDLAYRGFGDYARRNIRCGETYAEIAARCRRGPERLWLRDAIGNFAWGAFLVVLLGMLIVGPWLARCAAAAVLAAILGRKTLQYLRRGQGFGIATLYALHTYGTKLLIVFGILRWSLRRALRK